MKLDFAFWIEWMFLRFLPSYGFGLIGLLSALFLCCGVFGGVFFFAIVVIQNSQFSCVASTTDGNWAGSLWFSFTIQPRL